MPSIDDVIKFKKSTKVFKDSINREICQILPKNSIQNQEKKTEKDVENTTEKATEKASESESRDENFAKIEEIPFKKVSYRPWDDDVPSGSNTKEAPVSLIKNAPTKPLHAETTPSMMVISLYGVQRSILTFLFENIAHEDNVYFYTHFIDMRTLMRFTSCSKDTVETSLRRLRHKNVIESWQNKRGRGGFVSFRIRKEIRDIFLNKRNVF